MRRECRERFSRRRGLATPDMHHSTCVTHVPWCMPGSLTSGLLWSRWRGKRSRHSRRMRNPQFFVSSERPVKRPLNSVVSQDRWPFTTVSINMILQKPSQGNYDIHAPFIRLLQHCSDVIMTPMASQITSLAIVYLTVYAGEDKKKTIKALRRWPLCAGNSPVSRWIPPQMASNAENASIWWRHHSID